MTELAVAVGCLLFVGIVKFVAFWIKTARELNRIIAEELSPRPGSDGQWSEFPPVRNRHARNPQTNADEAERGQL
jgi:hypothetical protein